MKQQSHDSDLRDGQSSCTFDGNDTVVLDPPSRLPNKASPVLRSRASKEGRLFLRVIWGRDNLDIPYNACGTFEEFERKVREQLSEPELNISLVTEPVKLTPDNWPIYNRRDLVCSIKTHQRNAPPCLPAHINNGRSPEIPDVRRLEDLFKQEDGAVVTIEGRFSAIVTHGRASKSSLGGLTRVWDCLNQVRGENWICADGSAVSGHVKRRNRIFLDIGHAFHGSVEGNITMFCLVQESVVEIYDSVPPHMDCTPIYRVRRFADAKEAARNELADAMDGIGTIGSLLVLEEGSRVSGLVRKEIGTKIVWI